MAQHAPPSRLRAAEDIYQSRRRRNAFFDGGKLFGEPAYDMMLDLYIAAHRGRDVSVSSACIASDVPPTTALRHVSALERRGWVAREADPFDKRRSNLKLTVEGFQIMDAWLAATPAVRNAAPDQRATPRAVACTAERDGKHINLHAGGADGVEVGFALTLAAARALRDQLDAALNETLPTAASLSPPALS